MAENSAWLILPAAVAVSYFWRALGVAVSGRLDPHGDLFLWVQCVAYAMLAGLVSRMAFFPAGALGGTELGLRLGALALALLAFFLARRNLLVGIAAGVGAFILMNVFLSEA